MSKKTAAYKIMIVEDELLIALDLSGMLRSFGYEITGVCPSGEEALELVEKQLPDLIMMDVRLKGKIDGIDTARKILARHNNVVILYLTAYVDDRILKKARVSEPYGYLVKPVQERELKAMVSLSLYKKNIDDKKDLLIKKLLNAKEEIRILKGLIPICCYCKKIRNDKDFWESVESYISKRSDAKFTHGICSECAKKYSEGVQ